MCVGGQSHACHMIDGQGRASGDCSSLLQATSHLLTDLNVLIDQICQERDR